MYFKCLRGGNHKSAAIKDKQASGRTVLFWKVKNIKQQAELPLHHLRGDYTVQN